MVETMTPDVCVVGAGAAGLSAAAVAAAFGVPCVLVERGRFGGECLHTGCVPSKALLAAAHAAETARRGPAFGIGDGSVTVDFAAVRAHVRDVIASIAPNDTAHRYRAMGVTVIEGDARFEDARTLRAGDTRVRARRFVLATGSRPLVPDIPGLAGAPYLTHETIFDLDTRPEHLLILGAGAVALELGQAFRRLGSRVTVLARGRALGRIDAELAAHLVAALRAEGVDIREGSRIEGVTSGGDGVRIALAGDGETAGTVAASHLLVATGRAPVIEDLGLDAAGIAADSSGILVDGRMRTSNRRVHAIGDCVGGELAGLRFTHAASAQAGTAMRAILFRSGSPFNPALVPRTVYTDPEIATVGLDEEAARRAHRDVRVLRFPFSENDRARAERLTRGEIKLISTGKGKVLGAALVGKGAGELITPWTLALRQGLEVSDFRDLVVPYPTLSEGSKRAALSFYAPQLRRPGLARLLRLLRLLG